jgi:cold-inducible RNA-binding protein
MIDRRGRTRGYRPAGANRPTSAQVITDRDSGRSKGFGFVEMSSDREAQAAMAALNGKSIDGRSVIVNEARPQEGRGGGASAAVGVAAAVSVAAVVASDLYPV